MSFTWRGDLERIVRDAAFQGILDGAEHILTCSHPEVPHETGTLERSGTVTEDRANDAVYISYNTPYAVKQHEDMTLRHDPGRKAKYLEDPFSREKDKAVQLAGERVKNALRGAR